jgi:hypothetical protein
MKYLLIILFLFSFEDYILYNLWGTKAERSYRIFQVILQIGILIYLYTIGIIYSISFLILWWFGICDMLYYIYDILIDCFLFPSFEKGWFMHNFKNIKEMSWLFFTPFGLCRIKINNWIFIFQCFIGIAITILINVLYC